MSALSGPGVAIGRVIAAVDASGLDPMTLRRAVDLASRLDVEASGLFIEDANLFRLAELPMVRHLTVGAQTVSPLTVERLEAELRQIASRAATELEAAAERRGIKWSFRVVRGLPSAEVTAATVSQDLVVTGGRGDAHGLPLRLNSPFRSAVLRAGRSTLLASQRARLTRPLAVVRDDLPSRTLAAAVRFSEAGSELTALIVGAPPKTAETAALVGSTLLAQGHRSRLRQIETLSLTELIRAMREGGHDLLVLPADMVDPDVNLESVMREAFCDVLVIQ